MWGYGEEAAQQREEQADLWRLVLWAETRPTPLQPWEIDAILDVERGDRSP